MDFVPIYVPKAESTIRHFHCDSIRNSKFAVESEALAPAKANSHICLFPASSYTMMMMLMMMTYRTYEMRQAYTNVLIYLNRLRSK